MAVHLHADQREQPDRSGHQGSPNGFDLERRPDLTRRNAAIDAGRIRALYRSFNSRKWVVGSSTLGAILVVAVCALLGAEKYLSAALWVLIVGMADVGLTVLDRLFQRANPNDSELEKWGWARSAASGARALAWSLGPYLLYVPNDTVSLVLPVWGLLNLLAASVYTASPFFPCLIFTVIGGVGPASAWLLLQGTPATQLAALLLLLAIPFLAFIGALGRRNIGSLIAGRLDVAEMLLKQQRQTSIIQETMAERTRFFSAASHDLRQPLQALGFYTSLLAAKSGDDEHREILDRILECTNSLNRQFRAVIGIAATEAAIQQAQSLPTPLQAMLERASVSVAPEAGLKKLSIRIVPTQLWVSVNEELLERVLSNLVSNAVRYTASGRILLGARRKGKTAEIWIVDTGIGIAESEQQKIFDEFYQLGNPSRDRDQGFGLGLSIVKRLCAGLDWPFGVSSVMGRGSIFKVTVPIAASTGRPVSEDATRVTQAPEAASNIIVLDDDPLVRDAMTKLVSSWGFAVHACRSGDEAIAVLQSSETSSPWRMLVDYRLSGDENGLALVQRLRQTIRGDFEAILMTAETDEDIFKRAEELKIATLRKPIKPIRLRAVLTSANGGMGEPA